jgi:integrase
MTHSPSDDMIIHGEIVEEEKSLAAATPYENFALHQAGRAANFAAAQGVFADYVSRRAENTLRRQKADLRLFADFLNDAGVPASADALQSDPDAWNGMTWGIVEGFKRWMLSVGYAVGSVNVRLSTVKTYAGLAFKAGAIDGSEHAMIRTVNGFSHKESKRVDQKRQVTRVGDKKSEPTRLSHEQAVQLREQPDTPQGRRDALLMCLLLEHGLRCGEVALIKVDNVDLKAGELRFYRPKVDKEQVHILTANTLRAAFAYMMGGDAPDKGPLLRSSRKGGQLTSAGMTERAITKRVRYLGDQIGVERLSAHDCRHYWATHAARSGTDPFALQEAGGWNSLTMPRRYVEDSKVANKGVKGF